MGSIKDSIQEFFLTRKLEKAINNNQTKRYTVPSEKAQSIGIYFKSDSAQYSKQINDFVKGLKSEGKKVEAITYLNTSQDNPFNFPYQVLKDEDISLFGDIKKEKITQFMEADFDYLFCISDEVNLPIKYVLAMSKAKCRVGLHNEYSERLFDFMLSNDKKGDLQAFIKDILHYTSHISKELV